MRKIKFWLMALIVLASAALPVRNQVLQARENQALVRKIELYLENLGEEALERQKNLARWYNYNLSQGETELETIYGSILNFGDGAMAVLEVPEMGLRLPVFHGEEGNVGHIADSDFPIGGRGNHTVLTVKSWMPWERGMTVYIDCLGSRIAYRVETVQVMPTGWTWEWPSGQERLTMIHDNRGTRTIIRCVRCGELSLNRSENHLNGCTVLWLILLKSLVYWMRWSIRGGKYPGFSPKTNRKSKLLRNYGCKILKIDV